MATVPEDQGKVAELGSSRPWEGGSLRGKQSGRGPRVVSCFGESIAASLHEAGRRNVKRAVRTVPSLPPLVLVLAMCWS